MAHAETRPPRGLLLTLGTLTALLAGAAAAEPGPAARPGNGPAAVEVEGGSPSPTPWLDEVRAQRQAWEARRRDARESFEARRRASDPRGAAHQDAWQEEVERRREARRQRIEQDREHFRDLGPSPPPGPWAELPVPPPAAQPGHLQTGAPPRPPEAHSYPPGTPPPAPFMPQDWDNPWYYRGY